MSNDYNKHGDDHGDDSYENHVDDSNGDFDDGHSDSRDDSYTGNDGYQFSITNGAITGIIEIDNGYAKQERIEFGETWDVSGNEVIKTEFEHGVTQVSVYADTNTDGIFNKISQSYFSSTPNSISNDFDDGQSDSIDGSDFGKPITVDLPSISTYTVVQPANTPYGNDGYQFSVTNGAITGIIEIENGYAKQERIEFGETWEVSGSEVIKTEIEHGFTQVSVYADTDTDGIFNKISQSYFSSTPNSSDTQLQLDQMSFGLSIAGGEATDDIWEGGDFADIYYGASGRDILHGASGDDALHGGNDNDDLYGEIGNDYLYGSSGDDYLNGGEGIDYATYLGTHDQYEVNLNMTDLEVIDLVLGRDGFDRLFDVERLSFSDTSIALDTDGTAGQAYRIYEAVLGRAPDLEGLGYWINDMDNGASLVTVAKGFIESSEFIDKFGADPSNETYINLLYNNILEREPDVEGLNYWLSKMEKGIDSPEVVLASFSEGYENTANVALDIANGIYYTPWIT